MHLNLKRLRKTETKYENAVLKNVKLFKIKPTKEWQLNIPIAKKNTHIKLNCSHHPKINNHKNRQDQERQTRKPMFNR